jgi:outer membrane protein assembly factor BamD (BamD/ComL family)
MYYDSTAYFLDQQHPDYNAIHDKSLDLKALVTQLNIIEREDSLQMVALMPEPERNALIAQIIATAAIDERASTENEDRYNIGQYYENERRNVGNIEQEGKWYFYNQSALTFGRTEFRRRWGDRRLEDNWRRSNKTRVNIAQVEDDGTLQEGSDTSAAATDHTKPGFYLKDLPLTDSALAVSNEKISVALLDAGKAYSERIQDTTMAGKTLDMLINRFPDSPLVPEALYLLYILNKEQNSSRAESYRKYLVDKYPESEFARILSDPAYYEKKIADLKINEVLYEEAYGKFSIGNYDEAINLSNAALEKYPQNSLAPKFLLLKAYSVAAVSDERKFREELNIVIKTWPGTDESKKASEVISFLDEKTPELKVEEEIKIAAELFVADTTSSHTFMVVINNPSFNINQATFDVISYNIDNYANKNFKTEGKSIDNKYIMITVSGFPAYKQAMDYYNNFEARLVIRNTANTNLMTFIINDSNLKVLADDKNPERYRLFFLKNYLK